MLSVIIPAYNAESTIERAASSVLQWEGSDMELIIVDDGSTDGTLDKLKELAFRDERVKLIQQENAGRSRARNAGVKVSHGRWLMFVDADDYLLPDSLSAVKSDLACKADLVMYPSIRSDRGKKCGYSQIAWNGKDSIRDDVQVGISDLRQYMFAPEYVNLHTTAVLGLYVTNSVWARLYRREAIARIDRFTGWGGPFPPGVRFSEDRLMNIAYLSILKNGTVLASGQPLYYWDIGESATCAIGNPADARWLPRFRDEVNVLSMCELISGSEREMLVAQEVVNQLSRIELLAPQELGIAVQIWNEVLSDGDFINCLRSLHLEGLGHTARWAPALFLITHGAVAAAFSFLRSTGNFKRVMSRLGRRDDA